MRVDQYIGVFIFTVKHDLMILGGSGWVGSAAITKKSTYCCFKSSMTFYDSRGRGCVVSATISEKSSRYYILKMVTDNFVQKVLTSLIGELSNVMV